MKLITTYQWAFVFLLISSFSKGQGEFFIKADSLLNAGLLAEASLQFDYVIYSQHGNTEILTLALLRKTECLKQQKRFDHERTFQHHQKADCNICSWNSGDRLCAAVLRFQ